MAALWNGLRRLPETLLKCPQWTVDSKRTAFILKRTRPIRMNKLGAVFKKKLGRPHFYYEVVDITHIKKQPLLNLVLVKDVPGVGMLGEKVEVNRYVGYSELLLPKLAVYADSEEAKNIVRKEEEVQTSSKYSRFVENYIAGQMVPIYLSPVNEWTIKPWHVKVGLRKIGIMASEECIELPKKEISGPDPELENKDFIAKLIMNRSEVFKIRCRILYWASSQFSPDDELEGTLTYTGVVFPEDKDEIEQLIKTQQEIKKKQQITGRSLLMHTKK